MGTNLPASKRCPSADLLGQYVDGELSPERAIEVESHLANCADCLEVFVSTSAFHKERIASEESGAKAPESRLLPARWMLGLAAAVIFGVATWLFWPRFAGLEPASAPPVLAWASRFEGGAEQAGGPLPYWDEDNRALSFPSFRDPRKWAFHAGVLAADARIALAVDDQPALTAALNRLVEVVEQSRSASEVTDEPANSKPGIADDANLEQLVRIIQHTAASQPRAFELGVLLEVGRISTAPSTAIGETSRLDYRTILDSAYLDELEEVVAYRPLGEEPAIDRALQDALNAARTVDTRFTPTDSHRAFEHAIRVALN